MNNSDRAYEAKEHAERARCEAGCNDGLAALISLAAVALCLVHLYIVAVAQFVIAAWFWIEARCDARRARKWEILRLCYEQMDEDASSRDVWAQQAVRALEALSSELPLSIRARLWFRSISSRSGRRLHTLLHRDRVTLS